MSSPLLKASLGGKEGRSWNWRLEAHQWVAKWVAVDGSGMREREDWFRREGEGGEQGLGQRQSWGKHQGRAVF